MTAAEYLALYNVTVKQANDFIMSNVNDLNLVVTTAKQYGVTNAMLAEIVNVDVNTVKSYLTQHNFNSAELDVSAPTIFPPSSEPKTINITVAANGSSDASAANYIYTITADSYNYQIAGFGAGDVLKFPATNTPSVNNSSFTDGTVELTWAYRGALATIQLTGISIANDGQLNSAANFNSVFGDGTIV